MFPLLFGQSLLFNRIPIDWVAILCAAVAGLGAYLVQTSDASSQRRSASKWIGIVLIVAMCLVVVTRVPLTIERTLFFLFGGLAVLGSIAFVTARQPVYAACNFAIAVLSASGLFMLLDAPFIAAATMIVYAGATIIIFLFVLMFAQRANLQVQDVALNNPGLAMVGAVGFLALIIVSSHSYKQTGFLSTGDTIQVANVDSPAAAGTSAEASAEQPTVGGSNGLTRPKNSVAGLGRTMYTEYLWLVEIAGALLTVAAIGAIVIGKNRDWTTPAVEDAKGEA